MWCCTKQGDDGSCFTLVCNSWHKAWMMRLLSLPNTMTRSICNSWSSGHGRPPWVGVSLQAGRRIGWWNLCGTLCRFAYYFCFTRLRATIIMRCIFLSLFKWKGGFIKAGCTNRKQTSVDTHNLHFIYMAVKNTLAGQNNVPWAQTDYKRKESLTHF